MNTPLEAGIHGSGDYTCNARIRIFCDEVYYEEWSYF